MGDEQTDDVLDLVNFLSDKRMEGIAKLKTHVDKLTAALLRTVPCGSEAEAVHAFQKAVEILIHLSQDISVAAKYFCTSAEAVQASKKAVEILVNLSQEISVGAKLMDCKTIPRIIDYIREGVSPHNALMVMLLCNLTVSDRGCSEVLQLGNPKLEGLNMAVLLKKFVMGGVMWSPGEEDTYNHVALILTNVTRLKEGRKLLLEPGRGLLQALVGQLRTPDEMRRRGAAGAIKNCCMAAPEDKTVEHICSDLSVLTGILGPINGEEPKEKDDSVREAMAESVLSLAGLEEGRAALWKVKAPDVLRKG
eukprot:gene11519-34233_t